MTTRYERLSENLAFFMLVYLSVVAEDINRQRKREKQFLTFTNIKPSSATSRFHSTNNSRNNNEFLDHVFFATTGYHKHWLYIFQLK